MPKLIDYYNYPEGICEYYPSDGAVCACNSDISGKFVCTREYSKSCPYAIERRKQEREIKMRCACGCGGTTNPGRKYIRGHNTKGKRSEETKLKISLAHIGKKKLVKTKRKMSISKMGNTNAKGKRSEETKLKMSLSRIKCNPDYNYDDSWQDKEYRDDLRKDYCENINCKGNYKKLVNHHIDLNKKNCYPSNIMTLCVSCHILLHRQLENGKHKSVNPKDFIVINKTNRVTYINKKTKKKTTIIKNTDTITFENKRIDENDFSMDYSCSFCPAFVSMVVQIPKTRLLICKSCLTKMIETIDSSIIRSMKK